MSACVRKRKIALVELCEIEFQSAVSLNLRFYPRPWVGTNRQIGRPVAPTWQASTFAAAPWDCCGVTFVGVELT